MKRVPYFLLALLFCGSAFGSPITVDQIYGPDGITIINGAANYSFPTKANVTEQVITQTGAQAISNKTFDGTSNIFKQLKGTYDFSVNGGSSTVSIPLGITVPANAIVKDVKIDVITQPVSTGSATVAVSLISTGDLLGATAKASLPKGFYEGVPRGSVINTYLKSLTALPVNVNIGTAALTAGKFDVFIDLLLSD